MLIRALLSYRRKLVVSFMFISRVKILIDEFNCVAAS